MSRELGASSLSQVIPLISYSLQAEAHDIPTKALSPIRCSFANNNGINLIIINRIINHSIVFNSGSVLMAD